MQKKNYGCLFCQSNYNRTLVEQLKELLDEGDGTPVHYRNALFTLLAELLRSGAKPDSEVILDLKNMYDYFGKIEKTMNDIGKN